MNTLIYEKPLEWYIAKIDYLKSQASEIPDIRMGHQLGATVLRIYSSTYKFKQVRDNTKDWSKYYSLYQQSCLIQKSIEILSQELSSIYHTSYEQERHKYVIYKNTSNRLDMNFYNQLTNDACAYPKTHIYEFDGHNFRSRFEMMSAQELQNLSLVYKYDSAIQLSSRVLYPDFALAFPEFNRCVLFEALGRLDDGRYVNDTLEKFRDYFNHSFILDSDLFTLGATEKTMPNASQIRQKIISIINMLCSMYVVKIA